MDKLPKVSIIIPFHKDRGWLQDAIDSVYAQTYTGPIELLRSDKINPETHKDFSVSQNINAALPYCTGEYIKFFAEDDMLTPICIEASVQGMIEQGCDFLHGNTFNLIDGVKKPYYPPFQFPTLEQLLSSSFIHGLSLFYKADVLKARPFDETLTCAEEMDLNLDLLSQGKKIGYVDKFLGIYRRHKDQKSLGEHVDQAIRLPKVEAIRNRYRNK
jgi:glycosyltransferase involved in cell wall biosynthesis